MVKWIFITLIFGCSCFDAAATGKTVFRDDFKNNGRLEKDGWQQDVKSDKDDWKSENARLKALCAFNPYKGIAYSRKLPLVKRGVLSFDVVVNSNGTERYNQLSLKVKFGDILTAFSGYNRSWMLLRNSKDQVVIGPVKSGQITRCRIVFDAEAKTVEYYLNDMDNPAYVDTGIAIIPVKAADCKLEISNYGLAETTISNEVFNLKMEELEAVAPTAGLAQGSAILFNGIGSAYYQLKAVMACLKIKDVREYNLVTGLSETAKNNFSLDKVPPVTLQTIPEYIIMADMPAGNAIPGRVCRIIADSVKNGSTLIILGGLFTLNKGEFSGTELEQLLPLKIGSPWAVKEFITPEVVDKDLNGRGLVKYMHQMDVLKNAQILATVNGEAFVVGTRYGHGRIIVCLGIPCGKFAPGESMFCQSPQWPEFIAEMISKIK